MNRARPQRLKEWRTRNEVGSEGRGDCRTLALGNPGSAHAQVRAKADVDCKPGAQKLQYDCVIKLANARTNEPLSGLTLTIGADMPSMPGAHSVRPIVATEDSGQRYLSSSHCSRNAW